jgi:serine protease
MNKKLIAALVATAISLPTFANSAKAENQPAPTIAILDTALDSSLSLFKDRIIHEACVVQWNSCPNGLSVMEGPGSASMPSQFISKNGFEHGTQMASLAVKTNMTVKIVFVRVIGSTSNGARQSAGEQTVFNALDWVIANKDKFNIQAVSMSQSHHNLGLAGTDYCPKTPNTEARIKSLAASGIPVFFPAGNGRDYQRIDWPACIPSSIAIGATMPTKEVAIYSNFDSNLVDFFAEGTTRALNPGGSIVNVAGTSASTVTAATSWATLKSLKPNLSYSEIYDILSKTSLPTKNSKVSGGKLIDLSKAINGQ